LAVVSRGLAKSDGSDTEPFVLTEEKNGRLVGRGSSDDKGPVLGWLGVLQWHYEHKKEMPVNLVMCFEGMEENGRGTGGSRACIVSAI
jgi:Cys-Gly metallodipeptidase DUG1